MRRVLAVLTLVGMSHVALAKPAVPPQVKVMQQRLVKAGIKNATITPKMSLGRDGRMRMTSARIALRSDAQVEPAYFAIKANLLGFENRILSARMPRSNLVVTIGWQKDFEALGSP